MYAGGANFMSLLFMYVYRICICIVWLSSPFIDELTKRGEEFREFICMLSICCLCIYVLFCLCILLNILIVYSYAWVKGELLWSLTLIHVYISPWVLSSSKRGILLARWPITLVLIMINSCSYSLLMILCLYSFSY